MDYRLRVSRWARGLSLRVTLEGALEVVTPRRVGRRTIARVLSQEQTWIRAALAEAAARRRALPPPPAWTVPPVIDLPAMGMHWTVALRPSVARGVRIRPIAGQLILTGLVGDSMACREALSRWLVGEGRSHLLPWLALVSKTHALAYTGATVRLARSRWGSCSRHGRISLNARLLLLAPRLVEYVMIHELCHTEEPNHSPAFWDLVGEHCPEYQERRRELRAAGRRLPAWITDPREPRP